MSRFRNDPHWQSFWAHRDRNENAYLYTFVPFLQTAEILLRAAAHYWYDWSPKRVSEILSVACCLGEYTERLRSRGLPLDRAGVCPSFYRYHDCLPETEAYPHVAHFLETTATHLLFLIFPHLQKYAKENAMGGTWLHAQLAENIEKLAESPLFDREMSVPMHSLKTLAEYGMLLECEGISYAMARISTSMRGGAPYERTSSFSEKKLRKLADEIGVPLETVKKVFEQEHSSWWETSDAYKNEATTTFERFLSEQELSEEIRNILRTLKIPSVSDGGHVPYISSQQKCDENAKIANTCIARFLAHMSNPESEKVHINPSQVK